MPRKIYYVLADAKDGPQPGAIHEANNCAALCQYAWVTGDRIRAPGRRITAIDALALIALALLGYALIWWLGHWRRG
jgi:hypothetical protein